MLTCEDRETMCGMIHNNRFYFTKLRTGNSRVSGGVDSVKLLNYSNKVAMNSINLIELLKLAGFTFVEEGEILDLTAPDKSQLIELFS